MAWLPHLNRLVPEVYEQRPVVEMAWKGFRNELRLSPWTLRQRDVQRFVIFAQGRTGSTLITNTLNKHSKVRCDDEILGVPRMFPKGFVENAAQASGAPNFGFHVKIYQLAAWQRIDDVGAFMRKLTDSNWKIIYLHRENLLRHVVSNLFAEASGAYHDTDGTNVKPESIYLPPERLLYDIDMRTRQRQAELVAIEGLEHLTLCYDNDLEPADAQRETFARVQNYLEIEYEELLPNLRKMVNKPLQEVLINYNEIVATLRGRPEQRFLDQK